MNRIVECVPNFSEGRDLSKIARITDVIESVEGISLLDVDPGRDTNRTVVTFVGSPEAVKEAAFRAVKRASELIDMSKHTGAHPRFGATDVCPFVPVSNITMDECVEIAREVGKRIGDELGIPVYLYENAATSKERRNLANCREGEYEGLKDRIGDPRWKPDYGPFEFPPGTGAIAVGAREFLIAYNVSLNTREKKYATDIAFEIREKGRSIREGDINTFYFKGKIKRDGDGKPLKKDGKFGHCKAIGWYVDDYKRAQISINLTNYRITAPHTVLEECRAQAEKRGLQVTGSEIVGVVPFDAIREAGNFYLERQQMSRGIPYMDVIENAVQSMGLDDVAPFEIEKKVIGLPDQSGPLVNTSVREFTHEVSRGSPAPGGGSIAALSGSLGAALASMVCNLTIYKEGYPDDLSERLNSVAIEAQSLKDELLGAVDRDTAAFNDVMSAMRMPKGSPIEVERRDAALQEGYQKATSIPLHTAKLCISTMKLAREAAREGNANAVTDAGVACQMAYAGVIGGILNVRVNLGSIKDEDVRARFENDVRTLGIDSKTLLVEVMDIVDNRLA